MAMPTSAAARAGASFVPSPIMATILPLACSFLTISNFVSGLARETTSSIPTSFDIVSAVTG
jgi:hypothetical protein